jgi:hypothetical protein
VVLAVIAATLVMAVATAWPYFAKRGMQTGE